MAENNNMSGKDFLIGALVGGIIGAGAALLLTPKSGREMRADLSEGYQVASKKTQELAKNVGERSEYIVGKVKDAATQVKGDIQKFSEKIKKEGQEVTEDAATQAKQLRDDIEDSFEEVAASIDSK